MSEPTAASINPKTSHMAGEEHANGHRVPNHIAFIMDGNGRWAMNRGLSRADGHRAGTQNIYRLVESLENAGVNYVTLFAFSTENWNRPSDEVQSLMTILQETIEKETQNLVKKGVQLRYLGRKDRLSPALNAVITNALELTAGNTGITLSVALDYGGRDEIVQAVKRMVENGVTVEEISANVLEQYLYTHDIPDPDLVVRTAGEQRLSNFLVWQSVYSEYYHSPVFWPDFDEIELARALTAFSERKRRFGALSTDTET